MPLPGFPQQFTNNLCIYQQKGLWGSHGLTWSLAKSMWDFRRLLLPPRFPSCGRSPVFSSAGVWRLRRRTNLKGASERGQARAWGCQGREKGLGLNENKLPDCNDFIPYLLISAIQSLPCFYPAGADSFSPVAVRIAAESLNSLRVFSVRDGVVEGKPHVTEGKGKITTRLWQRQNCALVACFVTFSLQIIQSLSHSSLYLLPLILRSLHSGSI